MSNFLYIWQTWHIALIFWIWITEMAQWRSLFWDLEQIFAFLHWIGWVDFQIWVPFIKRCLNEEWYLSWEREPFSVPYPPRGTNLINKSDLDQLSSLKPTQQEGLVIVWCFPHQLRCLHYFRPNFLITSATTANSVWVALKGDLRGLRNPPPMLIGT